MQYYNFDCGCRFPLISEKPLRLKLDIEKAPLTCKRTWNMISQGLTKGVFQLESNLGRSWTKKLKPESIEHLAALGALLRPGCLRAIDENGISTTEHYCLRKNNQEPVTFFHPSLEPILKTTFGVMAYQEQAMAIARLLALFTPQEADELRKAIGKKLPEEMAKVEIKFIAKAAEARIVNTEEARQIFDWIKESQRYSFNKSHAVSYAMNGYYSAYCKAHFPVQFFTSYLYFSHEKQKPKQEVLELVNEARLMNIDILPPDIRNLQARFSTDGDIITFGLTDIKGIGASHVAKLTKAVKDQESLIGKSLAEWTWFEILTRLGPTIGESVLSKVIAAGGLRHYYSSRTKALSEVKQFYNLSKGEISFLLSRVSQHKELLPALKDMAKLKKEGGGCHDAKRKQTVLGIIEMLENPATSQEDSVNWIAGTEELLLGVAITCSRIDGCNVEAINSTCRDYLSPDFKHQGVIILGVEIQSVQEKKTRNGKTPGQKMASLIISDGTAAIDAVCFPDAYKSCSDLLAKGNTIIVEGMKDKKQGGFIIRKAHQADLLGEELE
jgi:DNA polymerase III alpha subunit